jgi:hypothetical protein
MNRAVRFLVLIAVVCTPAWAAALKFTKLTSNQFIIHHQKGMSFGTGEAKTTKTAYTKAASMCIAAGFTHFEVQDLNVSGAVSGGAYGGGKTASADVRVKFYRDPEPAVVDEKSLLECQSMADPEYIELAKTKLAEL